MISLTSFDKKIRIEKAFHKTSIINPNIKVTEYLPVFLSVYLFVKNDIAIRLTDMVLLFSEASYR